jgi:hypothetical protein
MERKMKMIIINITRNHWKASKQASRERERERERERGNPRQ